jgi:hypothetical protein
MAPFNCMLIITVIINAKKQNKDRIVYDDASYIITFKTGMQSPQILFVSPARFTAGQPVTAHMLFVGEKISLPV